MAHYLDVLSSCIHEAHRLLLSEVAVVEHEHKDIDAVAGMGGRNNAEKFVRLNMVVVSGTDGVLVSAGTDVSVDHNYNSMGNSKRNRTDEAAAVAVLPSFAVHQLLVVSLQHHLFLLEESWPFLA